MRRCNIISSLYLDRRLVRAGLLRWIALHWLLALAVVTLVAVTWRLWTPQDVFPQVPLVSAGHWLPAWLDWPLLAVLLTAPAIAAACCTAGAMGGLPARAASGVSKPYVAARVRRAALVAFVLAAALLVIGDQHRLQPWAYQFALIALVLALTSPARALALARVLTIGIYLYSAWSKFDYSFLDDLGPRMVAPLLNVVGIAPDAMSDSHMWIAAAALPCGELLVACGLLFRSTRTLALSASVAMHLALLFVLGPWGLDHSWGVLLWNVFFIAQNLVLFFPLNKQPRQLRKVERTTSHSRPRHRISRTRGLATGIVVASLVLPLAEPWGWFDVWPSWGLYASRAERSVVLLRAARDEAIPTELRPFLRDVPGSPGWRQLDLQNWSLSALRVPVYPQNRFQMAIAHAVAEALDRDAEIRVLGASQSNRWTGERQIQEFSGQPKIQQAAAKYRLQANPRENWCPRERL